MHAIAKRFSPEARAKVVELFTKGPIETTGCGALVEFEGMKRCALSVACEVEFGGMGLSMPVGSDVANALGFSRWGGYVAWYEVATEASEFIRISDDVDNVIAAFSEEGTPS
jgi:hypothetical protein